MGAGTSSLHNGLHPPTLLRRRAHVVAGVPEITGNQDPPFINENIIFEIASLAESGSLGTSTSCRRYWSTLRLPSSRTFYGKLAGRLNPWILYFCGATIRIEARLSPVHSNPLNIIRSTFTPPVAPRGWKNVLWRDPVRYLEGVLMMVRKRNRWTRDDEGGVDPKTGGISTMQS